MTGKCSLRVLYLLVASVVTAGVAVSGFGAIVNVSNVSQLSSAVAAANPGDQIVLADGTYRLTRTLRLDDANITLRSASGKATKVIIRGAGINAIEDAKEGIQVMADDITIKNITLSSFCNLGIHIRGDLNVDDTMISGVVTKNIGKAHIKGRAGGLSQDVTIQNVTMVQTAARKARGADTDGVGGIVAGDIANWLIKNTTIQNIRGSTGNALGAIKLTNSDGSTVERNRLFNDGRGLILTDSANDVVRNNFIIRSTGTGADNNAMYLANNQDLLVAFNTVYSGDATYGRTIVVEDAVGGGVGSANVGLSYNLVRGGLSNGIGGSLAQTGSLIDSVGTTVVPNWFVNLAASDLHLTALAVGAIDTGSALPGVPRDIDIQNRPDGLAPDLGADESPYAVPEPATAALVCLGAMGLVLRRRRA